MNAVAAPKATKPRHLPIRTTDPPISTRSRSGSSTTAPTSTTPRGCCAPSATRPGSTSAGRPPRSLAKESSAAGALATVSGPRIRDELMDPLHEPRRPRHRALGRRLRPRGTRSGTERRRRLLASARSAPRETNADPAFSGPGGTLPRLIADAGFVAGLPLAPRTATPCYEQPAKAPALAQLPGWGAAPFRAPRAAPREPPESLALTLASAHPGAADLASSRTFRT